MERNKNKVMLIAGAVLAVVGVVVWAYQIIAGLGVTGITQNYIWGLYIATFYVAAAAGAGCLLVAGIKLLAGGAADKRLFAGSISAHIVAGLLIGIDTGTITNIFSLVLNPKFSSSIVQDFWCLVLGFALAITGYVMTRKDKNIPKALAVVFVAAPALLMIIEGSMLSAMPGHPFWGTGTIASFVFAMLCMACCAALVAEIKEGLAKWILIAVMLLEVLISAFDAFGNLALGLSMSAYFAGEMGVAFALYVVVGVVLPAAMLVASNNRLVTVSAAVLVALGLVANKLWMLNAGFANPVVTLPTYSDPGITLIELVGTIGLVGAGLLIYALCMKEGKDSQ